MLKAIFHVQVALGKKIYIYFSCTSSTRKKKITKYPSQTSNTNHSYSSLSREYIALTFIVNKNKPLGGITN